MQHNCKLLLISVYIIAAGALPTSDAAAELPGLLVPAYFPADCTEASIGGHWAAMAQGGSKVLAILNPDSGPDYTKQDMSIFCVPQLFAAGVRTIGYVATTYSKRTLADVYQDVDLYFEQFGGEMAGIFLDECSSWFEAGAIVINYYNAVTTHIRNKFGASAVIVANRSGASSPERLLNTELEAVTHWQLPKFQNIECRSTNGGRFPPQFLGQDDIIVGFEDLSQRWPRGSYHGICPQPGFLQTEGESGLCKPSAVNGSQLNCDQWGAFCRSSQQTEIAAVVLCASDTVWEICAKQAVSAGYKWIYVTHQGCGGNPFQTLPTYWGELLAFVQSS